ncbi:sulfur carrier protein ThiS [Aciduricibacillus chroicocephali]|uniref:Sulfur carrier protein ThiS n=1 Tax=Aciduricibacillus chroicocephali TaxID=3054939 RepID=A0ABY9KUD6_9BACI|nr:sulfur carrier protein ThiS [Bacillaceae bacterium 44XB]
MTLIINGNQVEVPKHIATIEQLAVHLDISNPHMIVEHNGNILVKSAHASARLADGDKIEMVQFVGGG